MSENSNGNIFNEFNEGFQYVRTILEDQTGQFGNLSVHERNIISETTIFLHNMINQVEINKIETELINSWLRQCRHVLGREFEGNFILRFYYFKKNYHENPASTVESIISLLVSLRALKTYGHKLPISITSWNYLERDMSNYRETLDEILKEIRPENSVFELFMLLNTIDMIDTINESFILKEELNELIKIAENHQHSFNIAFEISPGLKVYAVDLVNRINLQIDTGEIPSNLSGKSGAFLTLFELKNGIIPSSDQLRLIQHPSCLHLWWIANALTKKLNGEEFVGILPFYHNITDIDNVFNLVWGKIEDLHEIQITEEDIEEVLDYTDQDIKNKLYEYFINHQQITDFSRIHLVEEKDKAHAGGEISDFNVEFNLENDKIWVAIPIKSGRESKGKKMEQTYFYQFIRPLVSFSQKNVVVFPIILLKPTLNTHEFLSLVRAHLDLPIIVLNTENFTRFLKRENLLANN